MKPIDIAVIVIVALLSAAAIAYLIVRKLKGKGCCDCDGCPSCNMCKAKQDVQEITCPHCKNNKTE